MQVGRDLRRFLVQSAARGTVCFEVQQGCPGIYPLWSSKPPRMEPLQPRWEVCSSAWLFSQEKGSSSYPFWVFLVSVYLGKQQAQTAKWNGNYLLKSLGEISPARNSNSHGPVSSLPLASHRCKRKSRASVSYLQIPFVPQYFLPGLGGR